jgi:molecular chaperone DnaK (HSP70)
VNAVLIPRNTLIPTEVRRYFKTLEDGQRTVAVPVVEGESERPEFCVSLGKCVVRDLPPGLPRGTPIEVRYRYLANGRLAVTAWVPSTGHSAGVEIRRDHPTVSGNIAAWKEELLLGDRAVPPGTTGDDRAAPAVDLRDRASVIKRIDELYERIGRLACKLGLPPELAASQRTAMAAVERLDAAGRPVSEADKRRDGAVGTAEAVQLTVELSRARLAQRQAADEAAFAFLVLGRDSVDSGLCPPGAERDLEEIRQLRQQLQ